MIHYGVTVQEMCGAWCLFGAELFSALSVYFAAADGGMLRSALRQMFARLVILCAQCLSV